MHVGLCQGTLNQHEHSFSTDPHGYTNLHFGHTSQVYVHTAEVLSLRDRSCKLRRAENHMVIVHSCALLNSSLPVDHSQILEAMPLKHLKVALVPRAELEIAPVGVCVHSVHVILCMPHIFSHLHVSHQHRHTLHAHIAWQLHLPEQHKQIIPNMPQVTKRIADFSVHIGGEQHICTADAACWPENAAS